MTLSITYGIKPVSFFLIVLEDFLPVEAQHATGRQNKSPFGPRPLEGKSKPRHAFGITSVGLWVLWGPSGRTCPGPSGLSLRGGRSRIGEGTPFSPQPAPPNPPGFPPFPIGARFGLRAVSCSSGGLAPASTWGGFNGGQRVRCFALSGKRREIFPARAPPPAFYSHAREDADGERTRSRFLKICRSR